MEAVFLFQDCNGDAFAFLTVGHGFDDSDLVSFVFFRPNAFLDLALVEGNHFVGSSYDMSGGAVILFQFEYMDAAIFEIFFKVEDILNSGAAEGVDALCISPYHAYVARAAGVIHQFAHDGILEGIGILKLVDQYKAELIPVFIQDAVGVLLEQFVEPVEQVVEVHGAGALTTGGIFVVDGMKLWSLGHLVLKPQFLILFVAFWRYEIAFGGRNA